MKRLLVCLALVLCGIGSACATTGVAFVHGTGHQTDAYHDYWQSTMIESVRGGLSDPSNLLVVNCDFEQYMWDSRAAGCLATQLYSFITSHGIDDLVVITHSNGGNVMRWIMSNPTWTAATRPSSPGSAGSTPLPHPAPARHWPTR